MLSKLRNELLEEHSRIFHSGVCNSESCVLIRVTQRKSEETAGFIEVMHTNMLSEPGCDYLICIFCVNKWTSMQAEWRTWWGSNNSKDKVTTRRTMNGDFEFQLLRTHFSIHNRYITYHTDINMLTKDTHCLRCTALNLLRTLLRFCNLQHRSALNMGVADLNISRWDNWRISLMTLWKLYF